MLHKCAQAVTAAALQETLDFEYCIIASGCNFGPFHKPGDPTRDERFCSFCTETIPGMCDENSDPLPERLNMIQQSPGDDEL